MVWLMISNLENVADQLLNLLFDFLNQYENGERETKEMKRNSIKYGSNAPAHWNLKLQSIRSFNSAHGWKNTKLTRLYFALKKRFSSDKEKDKGPTNRIPEQDAAVMVFLRISNYVAKMRDF